jgi:FkbM family methyltransferase
MKKSKKFSGLINDLKWFIEKRLLLFFLVEIIRVSLLLFGKKIRGKIIELLKIEEIRGIINYNSLKIIIRFMDVGNFKEIFEWNVYGESFKRRKVIVDVGAHIGLFTIKHARNTEKIVAIEPSPKNFNILEENLKINDIKNVEMLNVAISNRKGYSFLYGSGGSASIVKTSTNEKYTIKLTTLDNICKYLKSIDLMKIDVEGAEELVLRGGKNTLEKVKKIVMEVHPNLVKEEKIIDLLSRRGFKIKRLPSWVEGTFILLCEKKKKDNI